MIPHENYVFESGALWDSEAGIIETYREVFFRLNKRYSYIKKPTNNELEKLLGPSLNANLARLIPDHSNIRAEAHNLYRSLYDTPEVQNTIELYPGISAALEGLQREGKRLFVVTENAAGVADKSLKRLGIRRYFLAVEGTRLSGETTRREDIIKRLVDRESRKGILIEPSNTVFICSRMRSAEAAMNLGYRIIIAEWGISPLYARRKTNELRNAVLKEFGEILTVREPKALPGIMGLLGGEDGVSFVRPQKRFTKAKSSQLHHL